MAYEDVCLKRHTLILNWNDKGYEIIRNLHAADVVDPRQIVIVTDRSVKLEGSVPENRGTVMVPGDASDVDVLRMANAEHAEAAIILSDADGGDVQSILVALSLHEVSSNPHVVAEVVEAANLEHFANISHAVDEVICPEDFVSRMLAQSAIFPGSGVISFYEQLLSQSEEASEVYIVPVPRSDRFTTYGEIQEILIGLDDPPIVPLGFVVAEDGPEHGLVLNPELQGERGLPYEFKEGDQIVLLADSKPELGAVLSARGHRG